MIERVKSVFPNATVTQKPAKALTFSVVMPGYDIEVTLWLAEQDIWALTDHARKLPRIDAPLEELPLMFASRERRLISDVVKKKKSPVDMSAKLPGFTNIEGGRRWTRTFPNNVTLTADVEISGWMSLRAVAPGKEASSYTKHRTLKDALTDLVERTAKSIKNQEDNQANEQRRLTASYALKTFLEKLLEPTEEQHD